MTHIYEDRAYSEAPRESCVWQIDRDWPRLDGDRTAEIAIIGAGYTGLSAALTLAQAGRDVVVLEAKAPGFGASGRNGGFCCLGGARLGHAGLAKRYGNDAADGFFKAELDAIALVEEIIARERIEVQRHSDGEVQIAHQANRMGELREEAQVLGRFGIETEVLSQDDLTARGMSGTGFHGGLHVKAGFGLDAGAYVTGLAHAASRAGADILGESPVTEITPENGQYRLTTPSGTVRARQILLATNGYSSERLPRWLRGRYLPAQSSALVTRPLTPEEQVAQGWTSDLMAYDTRILLHYFRLMPDGRFLLGMRGGVSASDRAEAATRARLLSHFHHLFPAWKDVEIEGDWSGFVNFSRRLVPHVGPIDGEANALVAMAYHGNGVAMGTYSGRAAAELLMGRDTRPEVMKASMARFPLPRLRRNILRLTYPAAALRDAF